MPPRKKGAAAKAKPAASPRATRASVPEVVTNKSGKEFATSAALSRPRRESAALTPLVEVKKTEVKKTPVLVATPSKKRGRPPTKATADEEPPAKKRGRPPTKATADEEPPAKKRGRPAKKDVEVTEEAGDDGKEHDEENDEGKAADEPVAAAKRLGPGRPKKTKRSRPTKNVENAVPEEETPPPKKRKSSATGGETTKIGGDDDAAADQLEDELVDTAEQAIGQPSTSRRKGKGKSVEEKAQADHEEATETAEGLEQTASGKQYWLLKAEQEDREEILENGETFNTKFTIDDLKSKGGPEPWDGVRNAVAAKNMRSMKQGDLAFFYASGGKSGRKPGIVGIMEVVKEHEPDQTAWDQGSYGYVKDEKARNRWCIVHVEFRKKLSKPVHLSELQKHMEDSGVLSKMQVLKQSRLSVTSVSEAEWNFITNQLIEGYQEEDVLAGAEESGADGTDNAEEDSTLIATEQPDGEDVVSETAQKGLELPQGTALAGPVQPTTESEVPSTDTIFPVGTSQTSRPASRGGSRASSVKAKATASRQSSRAGSLAPPATNGRGRSRTPKVQAGSAPTGAAMQPIGEGEGEGDE